ncbi:MAG: sugar ABC transporter permease [Chloroflexota bacterium]
MTQQLQPVASVDAVQDAVKQKTRSPIRWAKLFDGIQPYLYLLPAMITIGIWIYRPLVRTFYLSFFQWNLLPTVPKQYVGWENYSRILTLPEMQQAFWNTLIYIVGILPLSVALPLAIALITDGISGRWRNIYRALIFVPMIMAPVVVSIIWRWILHPTAGLVNVGLMSLGFESTSFFRDSRWAIIVITLITGWKLLGFSTLIFSAAIANLNREYLEAAAIDGANQRQIIQRIMLPLLSPTILFMVMLSILLVSQWTFAYINVLTEGGPLGATTNIYYILYIYGFRTFSVGCSSAAAVILFIGFGVLAAGLLKLIDRYSFYDS